MTDNPWYSFYVGDYARKTAHLSMLEHGAYRLLLDHYYATRSPLPNDSVKLSRICRARSPSERKAVMSVVAEFFVADGTLLRNSKCDSQIDKLLNYSNRQSASAKKPRKTQRQDLNAKSIQNNDVSGAYETHHSDLFNDLKNNDSKLAVASAVVKPRTRVPQPQPYKEDTKASSSTPTPLPDWMPAEDWKAYLEMRKAKRASPTDHAIVLLISKLDSWREKGHDPSAILRKSITSNWTDLYELKEEYHENTGRNIAKNTNANGAEKRANYIGKSKWELAAEQIIAEDHATGRWKDRK